LAEAASGLMLDAIGMKEAARELLEINGWV
jgi:hypothetical protein